MRLSPFSILVRQNIPSRLNPRQRTLGRQADVVPQSETESLPSATPTAHVTATAAVRIVPHSFLIFVFSFRYFNNVFLLSLSERRAVNGVSS
jgi:hypothetical protein